MTNIILVFLWKPKQNLSLALFDHVSHTIFEVKIQYPLFVFIDRHSIDSKQLKCILAINEC
jgi:hypothetical protein